MKKFYFDGMEVGYFEQDDYPTTEGRYRYMPYRGPGHYKMLTLLESGDEVRCSYNTRQQHVTFAVRECPEHGVLVLADFANSPNVDLHASGAYDAVIQNRRS